MRVPAHIRFTLAELAAYGLQSAEVLAKAGSAIHLVLTERQRPLPNPGIEAACSIISVEDADGITVAVLKHPEGDAWDRRVKAEKEGDWRLEVPMTAFRAGLPSSEADEPVAWVKSEDPAEPPHRSAGVYSPGEPVVPRREPQHAAPEGEDRFQRGVDAMTTYLGQKYPNDGVTWFNYEIGARVLRMDEVEIQGRVSLRGLAKAFLEAYRPQITISDEVRFGQAKRAMRLLLRKWRDEGNIEHLAGSPAAPAEEWADNIGDIISIEGTIDIDAFAKACWSVMKEGEGR